MNFLYSSSTIRKLKKIVRSWAGADDRWYSPVTASTKAGVGVDEESALKYLVVWSCVTLLAETIASLPLILYRRLPNGSKERVIDHPLYQLLHDAPNPEMTSFNFRESLQAPAELWGNCYATIERDGIGHIKALWPFPVTPGAVDVVRKNGNIFYEYQSNGKRTSLPWSDVFHVPGMGFDGLVGKSPIAIAREAIGLGLATEQFGSQFFGNGTHPGCKVEHPGKLSTDAHANLQKSMTQAYSGLGEAHKLIVLEEGMKLETIGIPPEDAQFLQTRQHQKVELCGFYKVPPHMVGILDHATFSNIEHQGIQFVVNCLSPRLKRWEQAISLRLLTKAERKSGLYAEFLVEGLLRGDIASRYAAYNTARQGGWYSANDIRRKENENPIEGGDVYLVPLNMVPADQVKAVPVLVEEEPEPEKVPVEEKKRDIIEFFGKEKAERAAKIERGKISVAERNRLQAQYHDLFKDAADRTVAREVVAIGKALKKNVRSLGDFDKWLGDFYGDMPTHIRKYFRSVLGSYAEAIQRAAAGEVGGPVGMTPELEKFINEYLDGYAKRHVNSSLGQLRALIRDSEDAAADIDTRLNEWGERRPEKIASDEAVRSNNAVAKFTFALAGVETLRWVAQGNDSCPYCQELDGRVVGINKFFVKEGENFEPKGAGGTMKISGPHAHPPLHQGCVCAIVAE